MRSAAIALHHELRAFFGGQRLGKQLALRLVPGDVQRLDREHGVEPLTFDDQHAPWCCNGTRVGLPP